MCSAFESTSISALDGLPFSEVGSPYGAEDDLGKAGDASTDVDVLGTGDIVEARGDSCWSEEGAAKKSGKLSLLIACLWTTESASCVCDWVWVFFPPHWIFSSVALVFTLIIKGLGRF